jgi:hypothetical protein
MTQQFWQKTNNEEIEMKVLGWASLLIVFLVTGCRNDQSTAKPQPNKQSIAAEKTIRWTFDTDSVGGLPVGTEFFSGKWIVRAETDVPTPPNTLCQTEAAEFPALVLSDTVYTDVIVSAQFKPISGHTDQAAGIIFRVQDKDNYYILRANALENNDNLYKYAGGQRSELKEGSAQVVLGQWQKLQAEVIGDHIRGFLNGQLVVEVNDNTYQAGQVGLWTKADSVTCFDDIQASLP